MPSNNKNLGFFFFFLVIFKKKKKKNKTKQNFGYLIEKITRIRQGCSSIQETPKTYKNFQHNKSGNFKK